MRKLGKFRYGQYPVPTATWASFRVARYVSVENDLECSLDKSPLACSRISAVPVGVTESVEKLSVDD